MARIIRKGINLEKRYTKVKKQVGRNTLLSFLTLSASIISGIYFLSIAQPTLLLFSLFLIIVSATLIHTTVALKDEIDILESGMEGENLTSKSIATLPESYTAFRNLTISYKGKRSEIDILVIGPAGIFVIETKNLHGKIRGNVNDLYWTQYKVGRRGTPYSKKFYNPVKQVNTHVSLITSYLKAQGIRAYITPMVYFANQNTVVDINETNEKTPVFSANNFGTNRMLFHILNNNQQLTPDVYKKTIKILIKM